MYLVGRRTERASSFGHILTINARFSTAALTPMGRGTSRKLDKHHRGRAKRLRRVHREVEVVAEMDGARVSPPSPVRGSNGELCCSMTGASATLRSLEEE